MSNSNILPETETFIAHNIKRRAYKHAGNLIILIKGTLYAAPEGSKGEKNEFYEVLSKSSPGCLYVRTRASNAAEKWYPIVDTRSTIRGAKAVKSA